MPLDASPQTILIRMPNWLGDCVMAMPAVRHVADAAPQAKIYLAGREQFRAFFRTQHGAAGFVPAPGSGFKNLLKGLAYAKRELREAEIPPIDAGVLFTNSLSTAAWLKCAGAKRRIGYNTDCRRLLLTDALPCGEREKSWHFTQYYQNLAMTLTGTPAGAAEPEKVIPSIRVADDARRRAADLLRAHGVAEGADYAVIAPSSAYGAVKDWPPEYYETLAKKLSIPVVAAGGANQPAVPGTINLAGKTKLDEFIGLLAGASLFVGGDSGGAHAAGALGIPTVVIFGITNPTRTRPLGKRVRYAGTGEAVDVDLATPAAREQAKAALAAITPEDVFAKAAEAMNAP